MNEDTNFSDLPFPIRKNAAKTPRPDPDAPLTADIPDMTLTGSGDAPIHGVHSFYEQGRSLLDERREHLARVGIGVRQDAERPNAPPFGLMTPEQANALKMPDLAERPRAPPQLLGEELPEPNKATYARPKLPEHAGVEGQLEE